MKKMTASMLLIGSIMMIGCGDGERYDEGTIPIGGTLNGIKIIESLIIDLVAADGVESLYLDKDGAFIFEDKLKDKETFALSISEQPEGQMCVITPFQGKAEGNNIANIVVQCVTLPEN